MIGIQWFNQNTHDIQGLIIARGGGSLEQLQAFNTAEVAKAIYSSRIPVMTAIGHEQDVTIADLVADVRASVPRDAGARVSADWRKAAERIGAIQENMLSRLRSSCRQLEKRLTMYHLGFIASYAKSLAHHRRQVDGSCNTLLRCSRDVFRRVTRVEENFSANFARFSGRLADRKTAILLDERTLLRESNRLLVSLKKQLGALRSGVYSSGDPPPGRP